jgi:hypothetical protein
MRRSHIALLTLFTAIALAQRPVVGQQAAVFVNGAAAVAAPLGAEDVVARMMSFDRNRDGRIEASELPDRMQNLFTRGDSGRDGVLDDSEIRALATTPPTRAVTATAGGTPGGYTFGDRVGLSARSHVDGALADLMLASPVKERAQAIVRTFVDDLEATAAADLLKEMETLLTADQMGAFRTAVGRQKAGPVVAINQMKVMGDRVAFFGLDLARRVEMFSLQPAQRRAALAAVERFNERVRPGDAERSALLMQLRSVISDEERDNFRAALERRPIVKAAFTVNVERNVIVGSGRVDGPVIVR